MVGKQGEWSPNHSFDSERLQPPPPILANTSKTTCFGLWDETEWRDGKPPTMVGKQDEWLENHSFDPGKRLPFHLNPAFSSKTTHSTFPGGSSHPFTPSGPSRTYAGPTAPPTQPNMTPPATNSSRNEERDQGMSPNTPTHQVIPPLPIVPKMTCFVSFGDNCHLRQTLTTRELELSFCAHNECQTAQKPLPRPTELDPGPSELTKRVLIQADFGEFRDWFRKWVAARAQHPLSSLEKTWEERNNADHIEREQKGMSTDVNHSLSELTTQKHPMLPTSTRLMCIDACVHVENSSGPPQLLPDTT